MTDRYVDNNGQEIKEGDIIKFSSEDREREVYLTSDNQLGTDATNPDWIKYGKAVPCEFGIYPFEGTYMEDTCYVDCIIVKGVEK